MPPTSAGENGNSATTLLTRVIRAASTAVAEAVRTNLPLSAVKAQPESSPFKAQLASLPRNGFLKRGDDLSAVVRQKAARAVGRGRFPLPALRFSHLAELCNAAPKRRAKAPQQQRHRAPHSSNPSLVDCRSPLLGERRASRRSRLSAGRRHCTNHSKFWSCLHCLAPHPARRPRAAAVLGGATCRVRRPLLRAGCAPAAPPRLHKSWMKGNDKDHFPPTIKKTANMGPGPSKRHAAGRAMVGHVMRRGQQRQAFVTHRATRVASSRAGTDHRACRHRSCHQTPGPAAASLAHIEGWRSARSSTEGAAFVACHHRRCPPSCPTRTFASTVDRRTSRHRAPTAAARVNQPHARAAACACSMHMAHAAPPNGADGSPRGLPTALAPSFLSPLMEGGPPAKGTVEKKEEEETCLRPTRLIFLFLRERTPLPCC